MIVLWNALLIALREIRRNLMRAFLTVLGVIIGVGAVITMITLGQATTEAVKHQISNLGSNLLMLVPGQGFGPRAPKAGVPLFSEDDAEAVAEQIPGVAAVAPVAGASLSTVYRQKARTSGVTGTTPAYFAINRRTVVEGRLFNETDLRAGRAVALIGSTVRRDLFGTENPIGARIRLGRTSVEVIGLLASKGQAGLGDQDDTVLVPLTTLQRRLTGRASVREIGQIAISAEEGVDTVELTASISRLIRKRRGLQPNEEDNFSVFDTRQIAETLSSSTQLMTMLLTAVAGVSLLVGGIGIMNIMLVSVTERTREIGIRLAIGARGGEVLLQFLVEAVTLSSLGGLIGVGLAFALCAALSLLIGVGFLFHWQINALAFGFSVAVGVLFGFMPARRAAALDPIHALRHE